MTPFSLKSSIVIQLRTKYNVRAKMSRNQSTGSSQSKRSSLIRGTQREILRKRPKNNNKAQIKLSEAILSILGDCWEKCICSSFPARLVEEFPASKVHLQPAATLLTGKFLIRSISRRYQPQFGCGQRAKLSPSVEGEQGLYKWHIAATLGHQIPSDTLNYPFPSHTFLPKTY